MESNLRKELGLLLSNVDEELVVTVTKTGQILIGGKKVDQHKLANLKSEADFLVQTELWKLINETIRELAQRAMFVSGETLDDLKKGRSILYMLDSQKRMLDILRSFVPQPDIPTHRPNTVDNKMV